MVVSTHPKTAGLEPRRVLCSQTLRHDSTKERTSDNRVLEQVKPKSLTTDKTGEQG
jgi:hypothetical protein